MARGNGRTINVKLPTAKVITALGVDNLEKVGKQARHLLEVNFSDESMANNYLNLYKSLL